MSNDDDRKPAALQLSPASPFSYTSSIASPPQGPPIREILIKPVEIPSATVAASSRPPMRTSAEESLFRLQPRHPKCTPSPEEDRGRKRRAQGTPEHYMDLQALTIDSPIRPSSFEKYQTTNVPSRLPPRASPGSSTKSSPRIAPLRVVDQDSPPLSGMFPAIGNVNTPPRVLPSFSFQTPEAPLPKTILTPRSSLGSAGTLRNPFSPATAPSFLPAPVGESGSRSLLRPPSTDDLFYMEDGPVREDESLDDPDYDCFLLASPGQIAMEKRLSDSNKQRKIEASFPSETSLRGIDFCPSSTSLLGLDRRASDIDIRDSTTTPPAMPQAASPPPLTPRQGPSGSFFAGVGLSFPHDGSPASCSV